MRRAWVGFAVVSVVCGIAACKKEKAADAPAEPSAASESRNKPASQPKALAPTPAIDLAPAAPDGDRYTILFRFDTLRAHGYAPAAEGIIAPLPDYLRVFGARERKEHGDLIGDVFDTVVLTTSDPRVLTATTLAARGPFVPEKMRAMLSYADSGVSWKQSAAGPVGAIAATGRFGWDERRVFHMPAPGWIILADTADIGGMTQVVSETPVDRTAPLDAKALAGWPAWLRQVLETDKQSRRASKLGDLLVAANIRGLTAMNMPSRIGKFEVPTPDDVTILAYAKPAGVSFHGTMRVADAKTAKTFVDVATAGKLALEMQEVAAALPPGSIEPLRKIRFAADGKVVRWQTTATKEETIQMCGFSAQQAARLMGPR